VLLVFFVANPTAISAHNHSTFFAASCSKHPMSSATLLLWDIDGTLLTSGGAGMRALEVALTRKFSIEGSLADIDYAGRTDRWILRQIFAKFDLPASEENFARYFEGYLEALPAELTRPGARVLPGVREFLERSPSSESGFVHGLLTGNLRRGAEVKLRTHGLWQHFPFGAFADDSEDRRELGPHALRRAAEHHGREFKGEKVWVIGDTPHDVDCGRVIGARTLALATGSYSADALAAAKPTALLADLSDVAAVTRLLSS